LFSKNLQNELGVAIPGILPILHSKKRQLMFLTFYRTSQTWFLPLIPSILPFIRSKKEEIIDY
jgi:hypothetical protein